MYDIFRLLIGVLDYSSEVIEKNKFILFCHHCMRPFSFLFLLSLYGGYVVRSFLPDGISLPCDGIFLPCDQVLDFSYQLIRELLRIVSKILEPRKDKGDKSVVTPFDSRNRVIRTKRGLSTPKPTPY